MPAGRSTPGRSDLPIKSRNPGGLEGREPFSFGKICLISSGRGDLEGWWVLVIGLAERDSDILGGDSDTLENNPVSTCIRLPGCLLVFLCDAIPMLDAVASAFPLRDDSSF